MIRVIANPVSGGGRARALADALRRELERQGQVVELLFTAKPGDAPVFAAREGADCVVAVGGDGTANEVANGLAASQARLAILPVGAANVVARELGLPRSPAGLAALIAAGSTRTMDVGLFGERRFLLGAGAGLDAAVAEAVHHNRAGKKVRISSYVLPALRTIASYAYPKVRVTVDGEMLCEDGQYVVVGNCRRSAGIFAVTPEARIDDGLLDVCVLRNLTWTHLARLLAAVCRPGFARRKDVLYRQGKSVELFPAAGERVPLQVDGDPAGTLPATFRIVPRALEVVAP